MKSDVVLSLRDKLFVTVSQLRFVVPAVRLFWNAAPFCSVVWFLIVLMQAIPPVLVVLVSRSLVERLVSGEYSTFLVIRLAACLVAAGWSAELFRSLLTYVSGMLAEIVQDHLHRLVQMQAVTIDLQFYDLPEYFDELHRAQNESYYRPSLLIHNLGAILQQGVVLISMLILLTRFGIAIPLVFFLSALPAAYLFVLHTHRQNQWRTSSTQQERQARYYSYLMTSRETAAEIRLFDLGSTLQTLFSSVRSSLKAGNKRIAILQLRTEIAASSLSILISGSVLLWFVWRAVLGMISLGDLTLLYQATFQSGRAMHSMSQQVGQLYTNVNFLGNLFHYLSLKSEVVTQPNAKRIAFPLHDGFKLDGVSFSYPGSDRKVIDNLDLHVPAGKVVALVGENGAGKSTLIKLLLRFYDPTAGRILLDGNNLKELALSDLRSSASVLFQQPVQFNATVTQNIAWGAPMDRVSNEQIVAAAEAAGLASIAKELPDGYDQLLGKWFHGGAEVSLGQWQRIALARAFIRDSRILILDEPTSFMDPWAEAEFLNRFFEYACGRTVLIITHRFTTAMRADVIHVLEKGRVVESGNHHELLALNGKYATGWQSQIRARESMHL